MCCSEIYPALNLGAIQCSLVSEPFLLVVVLEVTPANLRPKPPAYLNFEAALYLVAPIRAFHRFSRNRSSFAVDFERGEVKVANQPVSLAAKELQLLRYLVDNRERVVPREEILQNARLMMEAALSSRNYTTTQVKPLLETQMKYQFLPQTVPAYAATTPPPG